MLLTSFLYGALFIGLVEAHVQEAIRAGNVAVRGVNLGGWLVAEHWMSLRSSIWTNVPSSESAQGEYHTMKSLGSVGQGAFDLHRSTFITENDIAAIAAAKFNAVRVPVGYWIQGCDHLSDWSIKQECEVYAANGLQYLDSLVKQWALNHNVAVFISIHGAPGSQNGKDHSGVNDGIHWGQSKATVEATKTFANFLVKRYNNDPAFLGIGLLNEPSTELDLNVMKQYYSDIYYEIRNYSDCILSMMPFLQLQMSGQLEDFYPWFKNVWIEWHPYLIWGYEKYSEDELLNSKGLDAISKLISSRKGHPLFFGEWSFVTTSPTFTKPDKFTPFMSKLVDTVNSGKIGWTYWSWKIEGDDTSCSIQAANRWSLRQMIGRIASNATEDVSSTASTWTFGNKVPLSVTATMLATDNAWTKVFGDAPVEKWSYQKETQQLISASTGLCLDASSSSSSFIIKTFTCSGTPNQKWKHENNQLIYHSNDKCLTSTDSGLSLEWCNTGSQTQTLSVSSYKADENGNSNNSTTSPPYTNTVIMDNNSTFPNANSSIPNTNSTTPNNNSTNTDINSTIIDNNSTHIDTNSSNIDDNSTTPQNHFRIFLNGTSSRLVFYRNTAVQFRALKYPHDTGLWIFNGSLLYHNESGKCLSSNAKTKLVRLNECNEKDESFQWQYNTTSFNLVQTLKGSQYCLDAKRTTKPTVAKCSLLLTQKFILQNDTEAVLSNAASTIVYKEA
ncbi:hypothetical protein THRCLA_21713 [Thraustotheca clavata]|uniref:glucan 1,3-beta-glucosidase n=1 Tax=Thraustotheca clavata TaxID=74557 RepID=A0A1V9ZQG1_9STRA|nr:hypothetical protein THRCLA_21713 [Thraustotheca clavata]